MLVTESHSTLCDSRLLCQRDFPGKNTVVGCHFRLRGILLTRGQNQVSCIAGINVQPSGKPIHGQYSPWNSPGQNTRVVSYFLLHGRK